MYQSYNDKAGLTCIGALTQKDGARTDTSQNYLSVKHTSRSVSVSYLVQSQDLPRFKELFRPQNSLLRWPASGQFTHSFITFNVK